jgi:uncharacterized protein YukE
LPEVSDGGGGPSWTGTIQVVPDNLEASSGGFAAAGSGVLDIWAQTMLSASPEGAGVTDPGASAAFTRMASIWSKDLENLSDTYNDMSSSLFSAGGAYQHSDASAATSFDVDGTSITPGQ